MNGNQPETNTTVDKAFLVDVYKAQWADIHHNRNQDWEIAKFILAGFLGLSGLKAFTSAIALTAAVALCLVVICVLGILVTVRHRQLFSEKMDAVKRLETAMGIDQLQLFQMPKHHPFLRTQTILILTYAFWGAMFAAFAWMELVHRI